MSTHEDPLGAALDALGFHVEATREKVALARREDGARLAVTRREGVVEVHCLDVLEGWLEADLSEAEVAFEELLGAVDAREAPDGEQRALMDGLAWLTEREGFTLALTRRRPMEVSLRYERGDGHVIDALWNARDGLLALTAVRVSALPAPLELLSGGAFAVGVEPLDAWTEWFPREAASTAAWIAERVRGWQQSSGARVATGST